MLENPVDQVKQTVLENIQINNPIDQVMYSTCQTHQPTCHLNSWHNENETQKQARKAQLMKYLKTLQTDTHSLTQSGQ